MVRAVVQKWAPPDLSGDAHGRDLSLAWQLFILQPPSGIKLSQYLIVLAVP
jgi:hypothetical protein